MPWYRFAASAFAASVEPIRARHRLIVDAVNFAQFEHFFQEPMSICISLKDRPPFIYSFRNVVSRAGISYSQGSGNATVYTAKLQIPRPYTLAHLTGEDNAMAATAGAMAPAGTAPLSFR